MRAQRGVSHVVSSPYRVLQCPMVTTRSRGLHLSLSCQMMCVCFLLFRLLLGVKKWSSMLLRQRRIRQRVRWPPHLLNVYFSVLKCTLKLPFNFTLGSRWSVSGPRRRNPKNCSVAVAHSLLLRSLRSVRGICALMCVCFLCIRLLLGKIVSNPCVKDADEG